MKRFLFPCHYVASAYDIMYEELYKCGKRAVIFDIDNTLVEHGAPSDARSRELMSRLKSIGYKICLLSNNKESRVSMFNESINVYTVHKAGKPKKSGYLKAMEIMQTDKNSTIFVGDQIFTDIVGANLTGIETFLTKPISKKEEIQIVLKRVLEKPILLFYCIIYHDRK